MSTPWSISAEWKSRWPPIDRPTRPSPKEIVDHRRSIFTVFSRLDGVRKIIYPSILMGRLGCRPRSYLYVYNGACMCIADNCVRAGNKLSNPCQHRFQPCHCQWKLNFHCKVVSQKTRLVCVCSIIFVIWTKYHRLRKDKYERGSTINPMEKFLLWRGQLRVITL